jgi:outer membrane protein insertion porin family
MILLPLFVSLVPGLALASDLGEFLGRRVTRVDVTIEGAPGSSSAEMMSMVTISAGQDFSPIRIRESLAALYSSGLIAGARVEGTASGSDGVVLRFIVKPQARIDNVLFEGNRIFTAAELRARLNQLDPGERLSENAVNEGAGELVAFYSARGYYKARVEPEIRLDQTGTRASVIYRVTPGDQARVSRYTLDVKGTRIDLSKTTRPAAIVEGKPFTQAAVGEEVERIHEAYLQADYLAARVNSSIAADLIDNSVAVTIAVDSGPRVMVEVEGFEIDEKTKKKILPFYTLGGIDDFALEEGRRRLSDHVQQRGYFFAEVIRPVSPGTAGELVRLKYTVEAGRRYKLKDIDIEGMDAIPSQDIQDQFKSREAAFISLFGRGRGVTSNEMLRQDANLLQKRLREIGYRKALVEVRRGVSLEGEDLLITFDVKQGPRSYIEALNLRGNNVFTSGELRERLEAKPDDPLVSSELSQNADRLLTTYNTEGFANAEVVSEIADVGSVDGQDRVRVHFSINEGVRSRIRSVNTRGVALTNPGRLERDFYLFKEGEWLRTDRLQETERALYETNAFNSVTITSEPVGRTETGVELRDVTVDLAEAKRYLLIYGFGYQSSRSENHVPGLEFLKGARGLVQLSNTNMFGKVYAGSVQLRVSQDELLGQLSFQNPRPFGKNYPTLITLFARRQAETSFLSDRYSVSIQTEKRFSDEAIGYFSYTFERIKNSPPEADVERSQAPVRLGRVGPSYAQDSRDNAFDPTQGALTLGSLSVASTIFGGNEQFVKFQAEHARYYRISRFRDTVYSLSGRLGLATPFGGKQTLPISERFFAGGSRDLRGFGHEEAGPRNIETGLPDGGNAVLVINNELRFPIIGILGGSVFADTGNVFRRVKDFRIQDLTQTFGFGLRLKTPIGPVRVDLGVLVLNRPAGAPSSKVHFSFGQTF